MFTSDPEGPAPPYFLLSSHLDSLPPHRFVRKTPRKLGRQLCLWCALPLLWGCPLHIPPASLSTLRGSWASGNWLCGAHPSAPLSTGSSPQASRCLPSHPACPVRRQREDTPHQLCTGRAQTLTEGNPTFELKSIWETCKSLCSPAAPSALPFIRSCSAARAPAHR